MQTYTPGSGQTGEGEAGAAETAAPKQHTRREAAGQRGATSAPDHLEGGRRRGGSGGRDPCVVTADHTAEENIVKQKPTQYCKATVLQLKINS